VRGPERTQFKDSRIRLELRLELVQGSPVSFGRQVRVLVAVEDGEGHAVQTIQRGPHMGESILAQEEFMVPLTATGALALSNVRIREVARNHGARDFQLVFTLPVCVSLLYVCRVCTDLPVQDYPFVPAARSQPFMVRSERLRSPSYIAQLVTQREQRRVLRHQQTADAPADGAAPSQPMDTSPPPVRARAMALELC
jgi:hypothetical protein